MSSTVEVNLSEEVHAPLNSTLNATRKLEYMKMLLWQYENNRAISTTWHYVFLVGYILIGLVALLANGLVVLAMYRNKHVSNILDRLLTQFLRYFFGIHFNNYIIHLLIYGVS